MSTKTTSSKSNSPTSLLVEDTQKELTLIEKLYSKGGINWFEVNVRDPRWLDNERFIAKPDPEITNLTQSTR